MSPFARYGGFICALLLLAPGCGKKDAAAADEAKSGESRAVVAAETAVAVVQPFAEVVSAIGTVEPRAGSFAILSAPMATRVAKVFVAAGQGVRRGDTLIMLEQSGFDVGLKSAQASRTSALAARDREQRLVDQGIHARRDLDQAVAEFAKADADATNALRLSELSVLRAPLGGVVVRMTTALGASVDPSQPLVEIADPSAVDIVLTVQPSDAARIKAGNRVTLRSGQRATGEDTGSGEVVDVAAMVDSASRSVAVRVRATGGKRAFRIGETLFGDVSVAIRKQAIVVPIAALVPEGDGFKVFVVDSQGVAHARPVTVGGRTNSVAEILAGIAAGERIVTVGAFGVDDGAKIVAAGKGADAADSADKP